MRLMRTAPARFLSDTTHCPIMMSKSVRLFNNSEWIEAFRRMAKRHGVTRRVPAVNRRRVPTSIFVDSNLGRSRGAASRQVGIQRNRISSRRSQEANQTPAVSIHYCQFRRTASGSRHGMFSFYLKMSFFSDAEVSLGAPCAACVSSVRVGMCAT